MRSPFGSAQRLRYVLKAQHRRSTEPLGLPRFLCYHHWVTKRRQRKSWWRRRWRWLLGGYLLLLFVSHLVIALVPDRGPSAPALKQVTIKGQRLAYREWGTATSGRDPLILLHGSPSRGSVDFEALGKALASDGRRVIALDRWGYGDSEPWVGDYSFEADGRAVLALMDTLGIRTAHVGGWSYGGAPMVLLANKHPGRIRSVVFLASIGAQKGEGSGNYHIEHAKYAGLFVLAMAVPELVPHFGTLGTRHTRYAFVRDFWDCDQRPLAWELQQLKAPLLIVHGKDDPLIPAWLAEHHHHLTSGSRLVMLDASHFFPMRAKTEAFEITVEEIGRFLAAAESGTTGALNDFRNETSRTDFRALWNGGPRILGPKNWWVLLALGLVLGAVVPRTGAVLAGLAGGLLVVDLVAGLATVVLGSQIRRGQSTRPRKAGLILLWGIPASLPAALVYALL